MTSKELQNRQVTITSLDEDDKTINFLFGYIAGISSTKVKEEFLSQHMSPLVEQILKDTYGGRKYHIKKYEINGSGPFTIDTDYGYFHSVLDDLTNRKYTGQTAIDYLVNCIEQFCARDQVWLARILDGNLKIGVGQTFAEDSGKVGKYPCALANVLEKAKNVDILDGTWLVSRKLDGCVDYCSYVEFEDGRILPIGEVVKNRIPGKIKSWDGEKIVFEEITDYFEGVPDIDLTQKQWFELELDDGRVMRITGNDRVMTQNGWKRVDQLSNNDTILTDV